MWIDALIDMKRKSKMTTKDLSEKSGVPIGTINKLFAGQTKDPKLETIKALVYTMGYTLNDLVDEAKEAPESSEDNSGAIDVSFLEEIFEKMGYIEPGGDLSDADLHFLISVGNTVRLWFESRNGQ